MDKLSETIRRLTRAGLTVIQARRGGHFKVYHREKLVAVFSKNLDSKRGFQNVASHIKRLTGVEL